MARVYSAYNPTGWKPSGSDYYKHYQAWVEYWVSAESATQVVVAAYMGVHIDTSVNATYGAQLSSTNYGAVSATGQTVFKAGNTVTIIGTQTYTYNKTTSAYTVGTTGYVWSSQGKWVGEWVGVTGYTTIPALASYAVTFNANGGTGAPANQTKYYSINLTITSAQPTRIGYTFTGWNTAADGSGTDYNSTAGMTYTANEGVTLYAQWVPNTYTVIYDPNATTDISGQMENSVFTYDVTSSLSSLGYTRNDYLFLGWALSEDGVAVYNDGQNVLNLIPSDEITLYAVWKYKYTAANLQAPNAIRAKRTNPSSSEYIPDEFANGAIISVHVTPGQIEEPLGVFTNKRTEVTATYKITGSSEDPTSAGEMIPTTVDTTSSWIIPETANLSVDLQYDVVFTAEVVEYINNERFVKATSVARTIVPLGSFLLDTDPVHDSIGIFTIAPETERAIIVGEKGDVWFDLLGDASLESTDPVELLDALIINGINWTYWNIGEDEVSIESEGGE